MIDSVNFRNPVFVNTLGHMSGLFIFGLLIFLLLKSGGAFTTKRSTASFFASVLALLWNFGSLVGIAFSERNGQVADWLVAVNFSCLSLLPAVLFSVLLKPARPLLTRIGYVISTCSVALHFLELWFPSAHLHEIALLVVTFGFALLGITALTQVSIPSVSDKRTSILDIVCLVLFTISFLHFGYGHSRTAWTSEVAWHHAGIPLALVVLLRDYRSLVAETFIRFFANFGFAGIFAIGLYILNESAGLLLHAQGNGFFAALLVVSFCCSLVVFAYGRSFLQKQLTRNVFGRGDLNRTSKQILDAASECKTEADFLARAAAEIALFVEAEQFHLAPVPTDEGQNGTSHAQMAASNRFDRWAEVRLPLRFSRGDTILLLLGARKGRRRYLAEDISALHTFTSVVIEQVERLRADQLQRLAHEAELHALQAQVNPHFLFNALNTLYGTISRESYAARRFVLNLADLLRYCLQRDKALISLGEELEIVQAYLEIESMRLGDRLTFHIAATPSARALKIPVLSVQPLVENAIKHGISKLGADGKVEVVAVERNGGLEITVEDNGPGFHAGGITHGLGLGMANVRDRLRLCCGTGSDLTVESDTQGCRVVIRVMPVAGKHSDERHDTPVNNTIAPARRL